MDDGDGDMAPTPPWGIDSRMAKAKKNLTSPFELLIEREVEPEDRPAVDRLHVASADPYEMIWKAAKAEFARRSEEQSKPESGTWILRTIIGGAITAMLWFAHSIWERSALEERSRMEIVQLRERISTQELQLKERIEEMRQDFRSLKQGNTP